MASSMGLHSVIERARRDRRCIREGLIQPGRFLMRKDPRISLKGGAKTQVDDLVFRRLSSATGQSLFCLTN